MMADSSNTDGAKNICSGSIFDDEPFFKDVNVTSTSYLLKCISFNMYGFNQGKTFVKCLANCATAEIILLQETWLSNNNVYKLINLVKHSYSCFTTSAMEDKLDGDVLFGRPFGGMAILVKNSLLKNVKCIFKNERCIVLKLGALIICNVYFPSNIENKSHCDEFNYLLFNLSELFQEHADSEIILGGDFNCHAILDQTDNSLHFKLMSLEIFVRKFGLIFAETLCKCQLNYTYMNTSLRHSTKN